LQEAVAQRARLFLRADEPIRQQQSETMHEGPARQDGTRNLPFVAGRVRDGASQTARRYNGSQQRLGFLGFGQLDGGAATIWSANSSRL
jgi:hypothetical protein